MRPMYKCEYCGTWQNQEADPDKVYWELCKSQPRDTHFTERKCWGYRSTQDGSQMHEFWNE